jgi:hypothetical protein
VRSKALQGEEIMNQLPEQTPLRRKHVARAHTLPGPGDFESDEARSTEAMQREHQLRSQLRLPPTRAARPTRKRGAFLGALSALDRPRHVRVSKVTLALAVAAITSALVVSAPVVVTDTAVAANHGLALIGAASVPPSFIEPSKRR